MRFHGGCPKTSECRRQAHPWQRNVLALAGYVLVAAAFSWPLPLHLHTHLPGSPDGDTGVYVWNLWVFQHELIDHRTMPYFTGEIFGATGRANLSLHNYTAFANLLALPLVRWVGVVGTFNVVYLTLTVLAAYAMFLLARRLADGDTTVAWLAGVLFAWSPVLVTRGMGHFSLVAAAPLPVFVLLLMHVHERRSLREAIALGVTVAWATACDVYYGVFCIMTAAAYLAATSLNVIRSRPTLPPTPTQSVFTRGLDLLMMCVAGLVVTLLVSQGWQFTLMGRLVQIRTLYTPMLALMLLVSLRLLLHYRPTLRPVSSEQVGANLRVLGSAAVVATILMSPLLYAVTVRILDGRVVNPPVFWRSSPRGVDVVAMVTPNPNHPMAPAALREWLSQLTRDGYLENVASVPLTALLVIILAWRVGWRATAPGAAIALGFGLLALGPFVRVAGLETYVPGPWAFLRYLPIVGFARSPSRFFVFAMVGVAALFAAALHALLTARPGSRRPLLAGIAVALMAELLPAPRTLFSAEIPSIYGIVASDPREDVRVLELPFGIRDGTMAVGNFTSRTQFYQTGHGKPIIGGYLSRVSQRRVRDNQRDPVLGALIRLSEGTPLSPRQADDLRVQWPAFAQRTSIGYVVLDVARAPEELRSIAATLGLDKIAEHGPLILYRPGPQRVREIGMGETTSARRQSRDS